MDVAQITSVAIFLIALAVIISEKVHRAVVALTGAALVLMLGLMPFDEALTHVDFNTLGVLFGMMLFIGVVKLSGLFEFLAVECAHLAKGDPWRIMLLFVLLTALLSAFLDNVTTVLLIGPMTLNICKMLKVNPVPFFMTEIMASNIGGTATLIGDPPNIMIGSAAGYTFVDFIAVDAPAVAIILVVMLAAFYLMYGRTMTVAPQDVSEVLTLRPADYVKDRRLMSISIGMVAVVAAGFMFHGALGWESCVIALGAAALILLISRAPIDQALAQVEWTTLVFFAGLFIIVGAMTATGVIDMLADWLVNVTGGNVFLTMLVLLFGSAIISAFLDNIPFVATMIPILLALGADGMDVTPLWWAVSLGACLGGNGTLIGASANVVLSDISRKNGHTITFAQYFKTGFPLMLMTVCIAAVYLVLRFPPA
ncbi:SLC13 family permease [Adlercreutzia murintestinalis]|uniref:SLC13 family permease n=1 Tax=Adlercreutzia murintestinalis TaxID=2941325 RepID=UPI00203BC835|nr:ArsB/NhaD family transporter [Adlercreutzia murintestinalis]